MKMANGNHKARILRAVKKSNDMWLKIRPELDEIDVNDFSLTIITMSAALAVLANHENNNIDETMENIKAMALFIKNHKPTNH